MAKVVIGLPYKAPAITAERFGRFDVVIPYTIDDSPPFEVRMPEEEFTPAKAEELVRQTAKGQIALKGKEFIL